MRYLFILGRNVKLSVAEIKSYLKAKGNVILDETLKENGFLAELENTLDAGSIEELGGVISIGIVIGDLKDIDRKEIYFGTKNNINYVLWDFSDKTADVSEYLKKRFKSEKVRAAEKKSLNFMKLQDGEESKIFASRLIDEEYFAFNDFFGRIVQKSNYEEIEKRDMKKPVRREDLAISPRLAKIMINLAESDENSKIVDAFCGIGVVLQEALLRDIQVIGVDNDKEAIEGAKKNLKWFGFPEKNYTLIYGDSGKVQIKSVSALVSEPDFGKTLKKTPSKQETDLMIEKFERLIINVLNNMKKYVSGKFVFTTPFIKLGKQRIGCNFEKISLKTGLNLVNGFPIAEFRENQIVGRHIVVMKK